MTNSNTVTKIHENCVRQLKLGISMLKTLEAQLENEVSLSGEVNVALAIQDQCNYIANRARTLADLNMRG